MDAMQQLAEIAARDNNSYLSGRVRHGQKIVGYFCKYVPEELIHAAGFVPYRMRAVGNTGSVLADTYFSKTHCSFVRRCFDKMLRGDYDFLDGIVFANGCDHSRRIYDLWKHARPGKGRAYIVPTPHAMGWAYGAEYGRELEKFKIFLEDMRGSQISDDEVTDAVDLYNRRAQLLADVDALRKSRPSFVSGTEMLTLLLAVTAIPVDTAIELLTAAYQQISTRSGPSSDLVRVMHHATMTEETDHLGTIEGMGIRIVAERNCLASLIGQRRLASSATPLLALANAYLGQMSCPRMMDDHAQRCKQFFEDIAKYQINAIVFEKLEFCSVALGDTFILSTEAKKRHIPYVILHRELNDGAVGQMKTRVQALIELVRNQMGPRQSS